MIFIVRSGGGRVSIIHTEFLLRQNVLVAGWEPNIREQITEAFQEIFEMAFWEYSF